jgi:site-specific recombinase XerD
LASLANTMKTKNETLWTLYLDDFLLSGRVEGKKSTTLRWYKETLTPFTTFVNHEGLSQASLRKYVNKLFDRLKIATVDNHIRAIKTFLRFLYKEGYVEEDFSASLKRPRLPKQFPHVLNDEQVMALLKAPNKKTWEGFRNYVILLTFLDTGIRLSELLGLTVDRVNLVKGSLLVTGKGSKDRELYMGRTLKKEMVKWLKMRGFHPYEDHVFISRDGRPLKKRHVQQILKRLGKKAGIEGTRCSPHTLRHTSATNFIRNGGDVFTLQRVLGHADIQTCMIYVHMGGRQLQEAVLRFSPVDRLERG